MNKLRNLLVGSLLAAGTVIFCHGAASAQTMTCKEAVDYIQNRISSLQSLIFTQDSSQLGGGSRFTRGQLRDFLYLATNFLIENPQCDEEAKRANLYQKIEIAKNSL
ncbi:MAG: hypothetical protein F6K40_32065 [Okeania sp. SIO3I5]|uniref:hypothetical protein n=1 Tax=Okeania sp. SIO3I5 TaxID=2607805 RepID=UPI0013BADF0F|nr:hypothetical protein [Okeania sp. SIO3I5]NEQ40616.1 hypothetical protein [Okeania sp. SIO3I5]